jgi:hypothetical protein
LIRITFSEKKIGIPTFRIILTSVNASRAIIALLLALVIQWSQVLGCTAAGSANTCETSATPMSCCDGHDSCPCVSESDPVQKPAPLAPATLDLKLLVAKAVDLLDTAAWISPASEIARVIPHHPEFRSGFAGVPLSVAYCSFVI